jgi:hypothetical protein
MVSGDSDAIINFHDFANQPARIYPKEISYFLVNFFSGKTLIGIKQSDYYLY